MKKRASRRRWQQVRRLFSLQNKMNGCSGTKAPKYLHQWFGEDPTCTLCPTPATPKHIMTDCKFSLMQGHYTWQHNQSSRVWHQLLRTSRGRPTPCPREQPRQQHSSEKHRKGQNILLPSQKQDTNAWPATGRCWWISASSSSFHLRLLPPTLGRI